MRVRVEFDAWPSRVYIDLGSMAEQLYLKAKASDSDDDWDRFTEWINDDVREKMEFSIEDVEEVK